MLGPFGVSGAVIETLSQGGLVDDEDELDELRSVAFRFGSELFDELGAGEELPHVDVGAGLELCAGHREGESAGVEPGGVGVGFPSAE